MNITEKRFIECIKNWNSIVKKIGENRTITLKNYWATGHILAMFFDYEQGDKKEYIKLYLDKYSKPLRVEVYLLGRGESCVFGSKDNKDLMINSFSDMNEFIKYLSNLENEIKEVTK